MSTEEVKAAKIRLPNDFKRTANDFGVAKMAVTSTHAQFTFPQEWSGRWVHFYPATAGAVPEVACSKVSGREVSTGASNATNSASSMAGAPLPSQVITPMQLPKWDRNETGYLIAESAVSTVLYMWLADGE